MEYNVLIVDDEQEALNRLKLHLEKFSGLKTVQACQNGKEALKIIHGAKIKPHIVFMDIEMPEMNGIEVLKTCKEPYPYFVFVTAYNKYAIEAFEQNAIDYVLKPYSLERIDGALKKATQMIERDRLAKSAENFQNLLFTLSEKMKSSPEMEYIQRIPVKSIGKTSFIDVKEVIAIEAADQYVEVETLKKKYIIRESMDQLEKTLNPNQFFRTHRSYIVNINEVYAIENVDKNISMIVLKNQRKVKISNNRKPNFKKWMNI